MDNDALIRADEARNRVLGVLIGDPLTQLALSYIYAYRETKEKEKKREREILQRHRAFPTLFRALRHLPRNYARVISRTTIAGGDDGGDRPERSDAMLLSYDKNASAAPVGDF